MKKYCQKCRRLPWLMQLLAFVHAGGCDDHCSRLPENGINFEPNPENHYVGAQKEKVLKTY